jgi:glycerophosphoryl diester phosphodiesterase
MTHAESIALFDSLGADFTPELKSPSVEMPYEGEYSQEDYAQQLIDEYEAAGIDPSRVWPQSFNLDDVIYWIENTDYGEQAVYLDDEVYAEDDNAVADAIARMPDLAEQGVTIIAPPLFALVALDESDEIAPSEYARAAQEAGLDIITWTIERSGPLADGGGWYYQTISDAIDNDGDMFTLIDVLAQDVGVLGIFSDWPATVTYYANCMGR